MTPGEVRVEVARRMVSDLRTRFPAVEVLVRAEDDLWICEVVENGVSWGAIGMDLGDGGEGFASTEVEDALVRVYQSVFDNLWPDELTDPWPLCPEHDDHPLEPRLSRGRAAWTCDRDNRVAITCGELTPP